MKQPLIVAGGRRWDGQEMTDFWNENADAAAAIVQNAGNCILSGCDITGTGPYTIAPGIVAISHADGFKMARYAGGTFSAYPVYLTLAKNITTKVYDDSLSHNAQAEYVATLVTSAPGTPYITIDGTGRNQFLDKFLTAGWGAWVDVTVSLTGMTGTISYRFNKYQRCVEFNGSVTVTSSLIPGAGNAPLYYAITLPAVLPRPTRTRSFICPIRYHNFAVEPISDIANFLSINADFGSYGLTIGAMRPTGSMTSYVAQVSTICYLD
jgi:hypothetical protein